MNTITSPALIEGPLTDIYRGEDHAVRADGHHRYPDHPGATAGTPLGFAAHAILSCMDIGAKLQIKPGQRIATLADSDDVPVIAAEGAETAGQPDTADVIVAFVRARADLDTVAAPAIEAARRDKLVWIAYPKEGKLGTDLNRDILRESLADRGVQPVRQIAIDDVWSALRFRPA